MLDKLIWVGGLTVGTFAMGGKRDPPLGRGGFGALTGGLLGLLPDCTCGCMGGGTGEHVALLTGCGELAADSALTGGGRILEPSLMPVGALL